MTLRCLLYSADEGTAAPILQVLTGLDVEGEHCSDAVATVDKVSHQDFQIVIIDWDQQPEAGLLLSAARERKAAERPLTLAIVSDDASVPQALQAGANSILRKPIMANQVRDTLTTARDLLRSKRESAANAVQAAAAATSASPASTIPQSIDRGPTGADPKGERTLRAGEFLRSGPTAPGAQFETEADVSPSHEAFSIQPVDPLRELEPMASAVAHPTPPALPTLAPPPPPSSDEPRGLEWYKKTRGAASALPAPGQPSTPAAPTRPELLSYDPLPPSGGNAEAPSAPTSLEDLLRRSRAAKAALEPQEPKPEQSLGERQQLKSERPRETPKEPALFGYISGESSEAEIAPRRFRFKGPIIAAAVLAACAVIATPQAPWHPQVKVAWVRGQQRLHTWLNPQLVTATVQAPAAHEDFGRAGDEYKVPVAETIPDATTDPLQIQVLPIVDPTIKKTNPMGANAEQPPAPADATGATPAGPAPNGSQVPDSSPTQGPPSTAVPEGETSDSAQISAAPISTSSPTPAVVTASAQSHSDTPALVPPPVATPYQPAQPKIQASHYTPAPAASIPSSLKSQMASMAPEASGNKPVEAALPSIEPVAVSEAAERALLTDQPALQYPASAKDQPGTVILQVLIGRDGTVQDAKFMQGSLAFAKSATEGVKQWKFKPYLMNGRAASVQTTLTIRFKPGP